MVETEGWMANRKSNVSPKLKIEMCRPANRLFEHTIPSSGFPRRSTLEATFEDTYTYLLALLA